MDMERRYDASGRFKNRSRVMAAALGVVYLTSVHAARAAVTGTGGGPEITVTALHTSTSGQTVPPGAAGAPILDFDERTERQRNLDRVLNGICKGC